MLQVELLGSQPVGTLNVGKLNRSVSLTSKVCFSSTMHLTTHIISRFVPCPGHVVVKFHCTESCEFLDDTEASVGTFVSNRTCWAPGDHRTRHHWTINVCLQIGHTIKKHWILGGRGLRQLYDGQSYSTEQSQLRGELACSLESIINGNMVHPIPTYNSAV